jgi:hypothetical protein
MFLDITVLLEEVYLEVIVFKLHKPQSLVLLDIVEIEVVVGVGLVLLIARLAQVDGVCLDYLV